MGSVDYRTFLKGKVKSNGIVNSKRAVKAAELSNTMSLAEALTMARGLVIDVEGDHFASDLKSFPFERSSLFSMEGSYLPMPGMFQVIK